MSGARIQLPKSEDTQEPVDEDDDQIIIVIEGNPIAIRMAREAVGKIASERTATVNTKLRNIPAEFYPFIAGPHNSRTEAMEESHGVQVRVPSHHIWTSQPPPSLPLRGQAPAFIPAEGDNHITLAGDRAAVQAARAEIEQLAQALQRQLTLEQLAIDKGRHQFVIGNLGVSPEEFHAETGCAIILPADDEDDVITVIGPADRLPSGLEKAMDLAMGMQVSSLDLIKQLRNVPSASDHARNLTHYLRNRDELKRLEKSHAANIRTPFNPDGTVAPWELYSRDGKNAIKAQSELRQILEAHPPSRVSALDIDSFFHQHLQRAYMSRVKEDFGVHLVIPDIKGAPAVLIFEGEEGQAPQYTVPRGQPSASEVKAFKQGLDAAREHILDSIAAQGKIIETKIEVPQV